MLAWPRAPRYPVLPVGLRHLEGWQAALIKAGLFRVQMCGRCRSDSKTAATVFCLRVEVVSVTLAGGGSSAYHSGADGLVSYISGERDVPAASSLKDAAVHLHADSIINGDNHHQRPKSILIVGCRYIFNVLVVLIKIMSLPLSSLLRAPPTRSPVPTSSFFRHFPVFN